ncbi:uncharacterized protein LOC131294438 [Anopheles ziemanni]|uniref:uncharacterized protein LOC131265092 n=1 Tax=Anopheles coustani TaxID=139045 RepID=UPI0026597085|nr:uncharacterized protein LOC131265092 [Anopheles coustani]XP_058178467.1 uncharacterized protein LOC131294438 [Anopheles ziemanni]
MAVTLSHLPGAVLLYALVVPSVTGSYLRDVELIGPSPQADFNTVYYYPSYVKGEDPVEEFNRRRLHVDTAMFMDDDVRAAKRKRKTFPGAIARRNPKLRAPAPNRVGQPSDHERNYLKIRQSSGGPRYVRDDVEIFDIKQHAKRITKATDQAKEPRSRRTPRTVAMEASDDRRRYEESDPQIFAYERADSPEVIARTNARRTGEGSEDSKYFQDTFQLQKSPLELEFGHLFESNDGWEERYERQDHRNHRHQGKVKWADKQGGFGEHYWDLNHIQAAEPHDG